MFKLLLSLLLVLSLCSLAEAKIRSTVLSSPIVLSSPSETITLDIDENGTTDFELFYDVFENEPFLHINVPGSLQSTNKVVVTGQQNIFGKDLVAALPEGTLITASSEYNGPIAGNGPLVAQPDLAGEDILEGKGIVFVGAKFVRDGATHFGYLTMLVNADGTSASLLGYAWEDFALKNIAAGAFEPEVVLVNSITVASSTGPLAISTPQGTLLLQALIMPENASSKEVTWSVDDQDLASISQTGLLQAKQNGTVNVTATANDGSGVFGTVAVLITGQTSASVEDDAMSELRVTSSDDAIIVRQESNDPLSIEVFNVVGTRVLASESVSSETVLSTSGIAAGVYVVRCTDGHASKIFKVAVR